MPDCKFDPSKPVQTRDGRKVRILATDLPCVQSICAFVTNENGHQWVAQWSPDGAYIPHCTNYPVDLINIPERRTLRYRVALMRAAGVEYLMTEREDVIQAWGRHPEFVHWITDWQEHTFEVPA